MSAKPACRGGGGGAGHCSVLYLLRGSCRGCRSPLGIPQDLCGCKEGTALLLKEGIVRLQIRGLPGSGSAPGVKCVSKGFY